jgi:hypothetical protein
MLHGKQDQESQVDTPQISTDGKLLPPSALAYIIKSPKPRQSSTALLNFNQQQLVLQKGRQKTYHRIIKKYEG